MGSALVISAVIILNLLTAVGILGMMLAMRGGVKSEKNK